MSDDSIFSVDTLLKYMGNDDKARSVVTKIVRDACAPGMAPLEAASLALREQRYLEANKIFHSLRGSVGSLGARRLVAASLCLEKAVAEQQADQIPHLYAALESEYKLVLREADAWLAQGASRA